jgi:hypothetical protein
VKRPSKKDIKAAVDKLKENPSGPSGTPETKVGKLASKKSSQRIRKQGV